MHVGMTWMPALLKLCHDTSMEVGMAVTVTPLKYIYKSSPTCYICNETRTE